MKKIAIYLIGIYQKYISPYKGFSCAYRLATDEVGCSGYGKKVISRYGVIKGYALLQRRFFDCKCCSEELKKAQKQKTHINYGMNLQRGFCDVDCGGCDLPSCDLPGCDLPDCKTKGGICDVVDFCDCGFGDSKKHNKLVEEKRKEKIQRKMEKKKVSLRKTGSDDFSDGDSD